MADVRSAPAPAAGTGLIEPGDVFDSHAPTSAAGIMEPGVSHRSSLGPLMRPIEAISAVLLVALIGLVLVSVFWRYVARFADHGCRRDRVLHLSLAGDAGVRDRHRPQRASAAGAAAQQGGAANAQPSRGGRHGDHGDLPRRPSALGHRAHDRRAVRHLARARNPDGLAGRRHPARDRADAGRARREAVAGDEPPGPAHQHRRRGRRGGGALADDAGLRPARHGQHPRAAGRRDRRLPRRSACRSASASAPAPWRSCSSRRSCRSG